jgi:hypothetical protein
VPLSDTAGSTLRLGRARLLPSGPIPGVDSLQARRAVEKLVRIVAPSPPRRSLGNRRSLAQLAPDNHAHHPVEDGVGHGTLVPPTRDTAEAAGGPNYDVLPQSVPARPAAASGTRGGLACGCGPGPRLVGIKSRCPGSAAVSADLGDQLVVRSQADAPAAHLAPVPVSATTPPSHPSGIGPPPATPNRDARTPP